MVLSRDLWSMERWTAELTREKSRRDDKLYIFWCSLVILVGTMFGYVLFAWVSSTQSRMESAVVGSHLKVIQQWGQRGYWMLIWREDLHIQSRSSGLGNPSSSGLMWVVPETLHQLIRQDVGIGNFWFKWMLDRGNFRGRSKLDGLDTWDMIELVHPDKLGYCCFEFLFVILCQWVTLCLYYWWYLSNCMQGCCCWQSVGWVRVGRLIIRLVKDWARWGRVELGECGYTYDG